VLLELPRQEFPRGGAPAAPQYLDASDRVEISTHDLEATLRTLLEAKVPLTNLRNPPANLEDLFLELTARSCAHDQAAAVVLHARNLDSCRPRHAGVHAAAAGHAVIGMGFVFGGPSGPAVQGWRARRTPGPQAHPFLRERYVEFITLADESAALRKLTHQQIDLLVDLHAPPRYW